MRVLYSEHFEGINEKASRATGVSSNGEFWILHVLETIKKLEGMPKNVHIASPIDHEDEAGNKSIDKAQEALTRLKIVCRTLIIGTILIAHSVYRWTTRTNTPSAAPSYFWLGPSYNNIVPPVTGKTKRVRMRTNRT